MSTLPLNSRENHDIPDDMEVLDSQYLSSKDAVKFLLNGTLKKKVCRYCLNVASSLSELDMILQVAGQGIIYKVTIREMIASFHPVKVADDPNFPNRICDKCLDHTLSSYLYIQQCERSERALRYCFEDIYDKLEKLDPLEKQKKPGRQKSNPNYNVLYAAHEKVIDYAEPLITIVNTATEFMVNDEDANKKLNSNNGNYICPKCCQKLPSLESLLNHERSHPSSMLYHCHLCGKSFPKRINLRRHIHGHTLGKPVMENADFKCLDCNIVSKDYHTHLQHIEKHKFKEAMQHLLMRKTDKLCAVCLNNGMNLIELEDMVCLHGGYPEMMGDRTLYQILASTVPEMNTLHNYPGTKICEKCFNNAIIAYVFIQQALYVRNRLNKCISKMLENLNKVDNPEGNLFVEISEQLIMPFEDDHIDKDLLIDNFDEIDESKLKVEELEDEFRIESDSDESDESDESKDNIARDIRLVNHQRENDNKKYSISKLVNINGVCSLNTKYKSVDDVCSEFLTFKEKKPFKQISKYKFTCPICNKHFISDYFLRRHILKHVLRKSECKICSVIFSSKFHLYEHYKIRHILNYRTNLSCLTCGRTFVDQSMLIKHEKCHKTKRCQLCDKIFISQKHYNSHMQRHVIQIRITRRKVQNCSFCEKECASDNDLSVHVNKIHLQIKPYSCDMCDKQFYTEFNMNNHKKVHNLFSKEKCEFCKKTLKTRAALVVHIRKHIGIRPHNCQICNQSYYSIGKLGAHMKIYHGGKYQCKLCKKVFSKKKGLRDHVNRDHSI